MIKAISNRKFLLSFIIVLLAAVTLPAQMPSRNLNQVAILGWADDTHYLIRNFDAEKKLVTFKVDIRSGRGVVVTPVKTYRELLEESLPESMAISASDVVSPDQKSVVIVSEGDLYYFRIGDKELKRLTNDKASEVNTRFSPDGGKIAYTKNKDLYVYDLVAGREIRLSTDATDRIYNGYAAWIYMEEVFNRPRNDPYAAFWWAPDGNKIAYLRFDETEVPVFTLNRLDEPDGIHGTLEVVPYPKAGDPNPKVKMGIADVTSTKTTWIKTDYNVDQYIAWPFWTPDSKKLAVQIVNRDQTNLKIILADPATGEYNQIYEEYYRTWIEFHDDIEVLKNNTGFILRSYKSGWENLYYIGWDGRQIAQLTNFDFRVTAVERVDEEMKMVYLSATGPESTDIHVYRVGLDGKNLLQITRGDGTHDISISPKGSYFTDTWNSVARAGSILAYDKKGKLIREIYKFEQPDYDPALHQKSELVRIRTADGLFNMPAIITYPLNFDPSKKYPVIFDIYGGPDDKRVENKWQGINPSWSAQNGIISFKIDHRGSGHFGKRGLDYMYRSLGKWEILDYEDAVKWLLSKPYIDKSRMGITGGSYGGYITCLALTKGADYWTHGFAKYSVTDYRLYDNIYTERFMDTPQDNPGGYKECSVLTYSSNLKGKLFLTHGDLDDNVHIQNSIWLISKLQDEGKSFQFMLYPGNRHGVRGSKTFHSLNEENNFWLENFFGRR